MSTITEANINLRSIKDVNDLATLAETSARQAIVYAETAHDNALSAYASASTAQAQLAEVEKVVDILNWASKHGTYSLTQDTETVSGKYYFERSGAGTSTDPYVYSVVTDPASDPSTAGYYELSGVDEAISNYVSTHLALTDDGLFLQTDGSGTKIQIASDAIYLYDENGQIIATYSDRITLGNVEDTHITLSPINGLGFYQGAESPTDPSVNRVAYISNNKLYISQAEVTDTLRIGAFVWKRQSATRISLVYAP